MTAIRLDLDRNRIKEVVREAYEFCALNLNTEFNLTADEFVSKIDPYLDSNRVSTMVQINLPSRKYPELLLEIDLRRRSLIARMSNRDTRIKLNRFLTEL